MTYLRCPLSTFPFAVTLVNLMKTQLLILSHFLKNIDIFENLIKSLQSSWIQRHGVFLGSDTLFV